LNNKTHKKGLNQENLTFKTKNMKKLLFLFIFFITTQILSAQTNEKYVVTAQTLNVRSGEGTGYEVVGKLTKDDKVTVLEKSKSGWWYIEFEKLNGYVFSRYLIVDPYSGWEETNYRSGTAPYCENIIPKYDYDLDNYLRVHVGSGTDVVIKLIKISSYKDECIRIVYIRSLDTYEVKNIPEGRYYLKIAYGKDYRQKIVDNLCYVKFMKNAMYKKGLEILDYNIIKEPDTRVGNNVYENWNVPSFELSLDVIETNCISQNFKSKDISEEEFNN